MSARSFWLYLTATLLLAAGVGGEQREDELTSLSYISYLERYATIRPATQGETLDAVVNMPVLPGDRVETSRGSRVEIQLADGSTVWMDQFTTLDFDSLAKSRGFSAQRSVLYLAAGGIAVEVGSSASSLRVDSPSGTVFLSRSGLYRLELRQGQLRVAARHGSVELPAGMGSVLLRAGFAAWVANNEEVERAAWTGDNDDFWLWVLERRTPRTATRTAEYIPHGVRAQVLDAYGEWVYVTDLSAWGWRPRVVVGWTPYTYGRWYWTPSGWCWVSYEPWGWYPYHYGSWYFSVSFGWVWFWDPVWAPAWVHWIYTPGYVGWCPRGYYDWWWWRHGHGRHSRPHRWSEISFDFSGRVRIGLIDHRPWTFVPEDRFTYSHIERVRVDSRLLTDRLAGRDAIVRSGPLLGPPPRQGERLPALGEYFGSLDRIDQREVSSLLRRETRSERGWVELPPPVPTSRIVRFDPSAPEPRDGGEGVPRVGSRLRTEDEQQRPGELPRGVGRQRWLPLPEEPGVSSPPEGDTEVRRPRSSWQRRPEEVNRGGGARPAVPRAPITPDPEVDRREPLRRLPGPRYVAPPTEHGETPEPRVRVELPKTWHRQPPQRQLDPEPVNPGFSQPEILVEPRRQPYRSLPSSRGLLPDSLTSPNAAPGQRGVVIPGDEGGVVQRYQPRSDQVPSLQPPRNQGQAVPNPTTPRFEPPAHPPRAEGASKPAGGRPRSEPQRD
ncbi:MAG: FecR domain-containing protein [Thermoanaerobaculum sp.]|nr:FecR domain-containing protein [Thermoanaerobaculum sp.]